MEELGSFGKVGKIPKETIARIASWGGVCFTSDRVPREVRVSVLCRGERSWPEGQCYSFYGPWINTRIAQKLVGNGKFQAPPWID